MSDNERRFSLDPINVDPSLLNKIFSAVTALIAGVSAELYK